MRDMKIEMREELAEYAHDAWSGWMKYLFEKSQKNQDGTVTIPKWAVDRWTRQAQTTYENLSFKEKNSDRDEAGKMLDIMAAIVIVFHGKIKEVL